MNFDTVKASGLRSNGGCHKICDQSFNLGRRQAPRTAFRVVRRSDPVEAGKRTIARMRQLQAGDRTGSLQTTSEPREARQMLVAKGAELPLVTLPDRLNMRGAGHRHPKPALGTHRQPAILVIGQGAVRTTLRIGQRSQHQPVS